MTQEKRRQRAYKVKDSAYLIAKGIAKPTIANVLEEVVEAIAEGRKITIAKKPTKIN